MVVRPLARPSQPRLLWRSRLGRTSRWLPVGPHKGATTPRPQGAKLHACGVPDFSNGLLALNQPLDAVPQDLDVEVDEQALPVSSEFHVR